mmetsp:Transcript_28359/g.49916  ORF Transcript_28359/g.49916 Transcript_28359/m.49916 type:complete len:104 (-) Transcript_28359:662-973(-)
MIQHSQVLSRLLDIGFDLGFKCIKLRELSRITHTPISLRIKLNVKIVIDTRQISLLPSTQYFTHPHCNALLFKLSQRPSHCCRIPTRRMVYWSPRGFAHSSSS